MAPIGNSMLPLEREQLDRAEWGSDSHGAENNDLHRDGCSPAGRSGRKRRMTPGKDESARKLLGGGMASRDVAENLGVSIPTLYRWVPASSR
jgi:hypothetical protein